MTYTAAVARGPRIPVFRTAYDAYRLGLGAIFSSGAMFRFFVYGSLLWISAIGLKYYDALARARAIMDGNSGADRSLIVELLVAILFAMLIAAVQAPLGIALQRRILLGEPPKPYYFTYLLTPVGRQYVLVAFLVHAAFLCASLAQLLIVLLFGHNPLDGVALAAAIVADNTLRWTVMLTTAVCYLVASWLSVRLTFAFPATACDRQSRSIRQSLAETRGTGARLFFLYAAIFLPLPILYVVMAFAVGIAYTLRRIVPGQNPAADPGFTSGLFQSPEIMIGAGIMAIALAVLFVVIAAGAARAYQIRVERGLSGVAEIFE